MIERDDRPFPAAPQGFDTRNTTTFKTNRKTTPYARFFAACITTKRRSRGQWSVLNLRPKS